MCWFCFSLILFLLFYFTSTSKVLILCHFCIFSILANKQLAY